MASSHEVQMWIRSHVDAIEVSLVSNKDMSEYRRNWLTLARKRLFRDLLESQIANFDRGGQ